MKLLEAALTIGVMVCVAECQVKQRLSIDDAYVLIMYVPAGRVLSAGGVCPRAEVLDASSEYVSFQLRNPAPRGASGLLGNFHVELKTGRIWSDIDRLREVDSQTLREVRERLFQANSRSASRLLLPLPCRAGADENRPLGVEPK